MKRHILIVLFTIFGFTSCFTSPENKDNQVEPILVADREAPIGWVVFKAYEDSTFKYSLSSRDNYNGTYKLKGDTLFLSCTDTTIGIDTAIIREKSIEFFGNKSPRFAGITINKISK